MNTIGKRIKYLRERNHLNQQELADICGVTNRAVSSWELDLKEPRMGAIEKMASYFGIRKTDLIDGSDFIFNPNHIVLDAGEQGLIQQYRLLDENGKKMLKDYIDYLIYLQNKKTID